MKKTVIIHLSDIHFDNSENSKTLFDNLKSDLIEMKTKVGKYDLMAITGDCVDRGRVELFEAFNVKLIDILKACDIKKNQNRIIIVPGNHDVSHENSWLTKLRDDYDDYTEMNENIKKDLSLFFKEYNDFVGKYSIPPNGIGVKFFSCGLMKIRVIFVNSSWSTLTNNKYGELLVGQEQIDEINNQITKKKNCKCDLTIACLHHPLDWFTYDERIKLQSLLYDRLQVDFLLHGHIHDSSYEFITNMDNMTSIFCTGISYHKTGENCSRKDGMRYSIYEIDTDTRTVNIYLRSTNDKGIFVGDNRLYTKVNKEGYFTMPIGNVIECLFPVKSANPLKKDYIFCNRDYVELLMRKEQYLFNFYCRMEIALEQLLDENNKEEYTKKWKEKKKKKKMSGADKIQCYKEYNKEIFELFCLNIIYELNGAFFDKYNDVRILLRQYNARTNQHEAILADGAHSTVEEVKKIKNFTWGKGMIYSSYKCKSALLMSNNMDRHENGNTSGIWKEYLTIAIGGIEVRKSRERIPLFALNIATESLENERCLQALANSSIYDKLQRVFDLFQVKVADLVGLYES